MMKFWKLIAPAVCLVLLAGPARGEGALTELVKTVQPAVVKIVVYDMNHRVSGLGSGFFINPEGHLVTNYHVLNGGFSAEAIAHDGGRYPIQGVIAQNPRADLIKVSVDIPRILIQWLNVTDGIPAIAERVLVVGSPLGLDQSASEGIVSAVRELPQIGKFFQTTAPISPGSSGSPVLNMSGRVIGVVSFQSVMGQNINFAVSGEKVLGLVDEKSPQTLAEWTYTLSSQKPRLAEELCRKGFRFSINGEYKKALSFYQDATRKDPNDIAAWYGLSQCYAGLGQPDAAIETYREALQIHTDDASLHYHLGNYYTRLGKLEKAIEAYKKAIRIDSNAVGAYDMLGRAYSSLGRYPEAIEAHSQVLRITPGVSVYHIHIAEAYGKLGRIADAIEAYQQAIRFDPENAKAYTDLGELYGKLGDHQQQRAAYREAIRIDPDNALAHYLMGLADVADGDRNAALQEYKILKSLDPATADRLFERIYP